MSASSVILAPNGKPASTWLFPTPRHNPKLYKPRAWLAPDFKSNFDGYDRIEAINIARQLVAQIGDLSTAIRQKNAWAFINGWDAQYVGGKAKWGEEAEEFLRDQFYPKCHLRGPLFDFRATLYLTGLALDREGGDVLVFTESENHFPMITVYPVTRIGSGVSARRRMGTVEGGRYNGSRLHDGLVLDRHGRTIAIGIIGENGEKPEFISTFNADYIFEPEWVDQGHPVPPPTCCSLRWMDRQDLDDFLRAGMKRAATMALKRKTALGEVPNGAEGITQEVEARRADGTTETHKILLEKVYGAGDIVELSSTDGEDIDVLEFSNPHPNAEAFVERTTRECLASIGWHFELLNLASTGRAPTRLVCDLANQTISSRQYTAERRARRIIGYALFKAMKHGFLSKNDDPRDVLKWEFGYPAEMSVDAGNDAKAAIDFLKAGMTTRGIEAQKQGRRAEVIKKGRLTEIKGDYIDAFKMAKDLNAIKDAADNPVQWEDVLERLEQHNPNPGTAREVQKANEPSDRNRSDNGSASSSDPIVLSIENHLPKAGKRRVKIIRNQAGEIIGTQEI
jgi:hypothetical protein